MIHSTGRPHAWHLLLGLLALLAGCRAEQAAFSFGPPLPTVMPVAASALAPNMSEASAVAQAPETPQAVSRWPRPVPARADIAWPTLPSTARANGLTLPVAGASATAHSLSPQQPALAPAKVQAPQSITSGVVNIGLGAAAIVGGALAASAGEDASANDQKTASLISKLLIGFGAAFVVLGVVLIIVHISRKAKQAAS